jgi:signal transduction histidine kinase
MRILSVDDNAQNLYLIEAVAGAHGHQVTSARNGVQALEELEHRPFDLVISDILMPQMDGFELCHEVKNRERTRCIPFIFYTATYTSKQDEELALSLGASRFIIKPMEPEQFMAVIEEVVNEAQSGATAAPDVDPMAPPEYLKAYNARLICKLDRKIAQLEAAKEEFRTLLKARDEEIGQRIRAEEERSRLEAQLLQSQKLESIGRLAGGIAHDFNNLLTVINGYSELAMQHLLESDPLKGNLKEIRNAGERAARLTRQLLTFSRRQVTNPKPLNVNQVVGEIRNMIQRLVGDDVEVVTNLSPAVRLVMADEGQLQQVLLNLVVNARDAMPGGGRLSIGTERVTLEANPDAGWPEFRPGPYLLMTVADTGVGMDQETLQHIFEPFFTTKAEGQGTGLGLSIVYGIVRQSGGWVRVESRLESGATFQIYLPETEAAGSAAEQVASAASGLRGTETILVVEDYSGVRSLIAGILTDRGYSVLEAASGDKAVQMAEEHQVPIDLLVSDIQMPRMNGADLARRLRQRWPGMRVLFVSGCLESASTEAGLAGPGVGLVAKPFAPSELAAKIRELLDAQGISRETWGSS